MNILHYNLGLPPFRTGGLTRYSMDLAEEQVLNGNNVFILFPSGESLFRKKSNIKFYKNYKNIKCFTIKNSLPVSIIFGIKKPKDFIKIKKINNVEKFLIENQIEIIHLHTLMGLDKSFVKKAKELGIKIFFTTHDYFGICPKVNLINNKGVNCEEFESGNNCKICNESSFSTIELNLLTSGLHKFVKKNIYIKKILVKIKSKRKKSQEIENEYESLRKYYLDFFNYIDSIHYNSNISKQIYNKYIRENGKVIFIAHKELKKRKILRQNKKEDNKIRLAFFGNASEIKGLNFLIQSFVGLEKEIKSNLILKIYGVERKELKISFSNIDIMGKYNQNDLEVIYSEIDYTIIPSICYETFNFVSLESKFYGVPVIISDKIGAKDLFLNNEKIEFNTDSKDELKEIIKTISIGSKKIKIEDHIDENIWQKHCGNLDKFYRKIRTEKGER